MRSDALKHMELPPGGSRTTPPATPAPATGSRAGFVFLLVFLLYMFDYIDRQVVTSLFPFLKHDMGLSDTQTGLLVSVVYWSIVLFAFPASLLVDRWSRRKSISIMVGLWGLATAAAAFVRTFPSLVLTRLGVGIGESGYSPGGTAMISALFPPDRRSRMLGLWNASIPLGSALGVAVGGLVAARWGWHRAFGLVALPGLIVGALFFLFATDYRTVRQEVSPKAGAVVRKMRAREILQEITRKPSLLLVYLAYAGNTFLSSAYLTWLPSYFNRYWNVPMDRAGLMTASVLIFAIVGAPVGGLLADLWMKRRANARPLFAGISSVACAAVWLLAFGVLHGTAQYVMMMLGGAVTVLYASGASALTQDVVHPGLWAVSWGLCVIVQNLLGSSLGPLVTGALSDVSSLQTALVIVPAASLLAGVLFLVASRFYLRDNSKVGAVRVTMESAHGM